MEGLSNEILQAHANVLTSESSVWTDIVVKENPARRLLSTLATLWLLIVGAGMKNTNSPGAFFLREFAVAFLICRYSIGVAVR